MRNAEITIIHENIVKELLRELKYNKENACMTYDELSWRLERVVGPRQLASFLGDISEWCH